MDEFQVVYKSEAHLQSLCTLWYKNEYAPMERHRLILVYNNPPNARMGAILKSLGMERGPGDQLYFSPIGKMVWLEFKIDNNDQSDDQLLFEHMVTVEFGCDYHIIRSVIIFQNIIKKYERRESRSEQY